MIPYIVNSGIEQGKILWNRVDIEKTLQKGDISPETKKKLLLIQDVKVFAEKELNLKKTKNYNSYVDLKRPYVSYLLRVSEKFDLKTYEWSFPFMGNFPYIGYFDKEEALEEQKSFQKKGYDTYVRGVSAYSTLGWFNDPILASMMSYQDHDLVNLIIHETIHATIFIKSHADFNEQLATFLGNKGMELYYLKKEGASSPTMKKYRGYKHDQKIFSQFITYEIAELKKWYKANPDKNIQKKKKRLKDIQVRFKKQILPKMQTQAFHYFSKIELNNAKLLPYATYLQDLSDFEKAYVIKGGSFKSFLKYCHSLEQSKNPKKELKKLISQ